MDELELSADEMIAWNDRTALGWRHMVEGRPEILDVPCDIYGVQTVGQLLQHIVVVELRYAQRLAGVPEVAYEDVPYATAEEIFSAHERAVKILREQMTATSDWQERVAFRTRGGVELQVTRKGIFVHTIMHSIRHYAQLATLVRQHGFKPDWSMDYLFMEVEKGS